LYSTLFYVTGEPGRIKPVSVDPRKAVELAKKNRDLFEAKLKSYGVDVEGARDRKKDA
jgi:hypothetical protein